MLGKAEVHTRVKLDGEQLCWEGPGGVGRSQSGQDPAVSLQTEGGVHPTQISTHRLIWNTASNSELGNDTDKQQQV